MKHINEREFHAGLVRWLTSQLLIVVILLTVTSTQAAADVVLKLGDILVAEPGTSSISVIDPVTGVRTVISVGGLLGPANKTVGVALALDGDIIAVHRLTGLIRVDPLSGEQSVLSQAGLFKDPWAIAIDQVTGYIYVADSGYDNDRPEINEAGKIIRVDPATGAQELIAAGSACNSFPANAACQNTTSAGSYLTHPYGIAIDHAIVPGSIVVADMSSFNGQGAIIRIQPIPSGSQTLLWGPSSAVPPPQVPKSSPVGCPMGVVVEPNGSLLTTVFTFPVPSSPAVPPPAGTFYGCAPPGIFRIDLTANSQSVFSSNAPLWQPDSAYGLGFVIRDATSETVHRVVTAGVSSGAAPTWNSTLEGLTFDGSVVWENIGPGANWQIPFGIDIEPAPTPSDPAQYRVIVGDEFYSMIFRLDKDGAFVPAPGPLATGISNVSSLDVIAFTPQGGFGAAPVRSNGQPSGNLPAGTTQTILSLTTDVDAICRYSPVAGLTYDAMPNTFATTGSTTHSTVVSGLTDSSINHFYVRCINAGGKSNTDDFVITFSVGPDVAISNFSGTESPLSEGGVWDSPGAWADLQKNNGVFAVGVNAQGRLVTPVMTSDQYSEITFNQDPGASSWVGVATRVQSATNGSGYLAIAFAGEVRLYRTDDSGTLNFVQLAFATVDVSVAPRRLRLESQGNTHRVYFNDVQVISHAASGTIYSGGQPGIAASVFGGPQVKILSFEGGSLGLSEPPTVSVNQAVGQADPTNGSPINFTAVFSVDVADFASEDVSLGGTAGATTAVVTGGPTTYNIAISGMTANGTVTAAVGAGVAHDAAANGNAASTSTDNTVTYDNTSPTVTINQATGQGDPATASPINFTVVFSESVADFTAADVSLGGATGATIAGVTGGPTSYNVAVSGMTTSGTVSATVAAGVAHDAAGNGNGASTSTDNTVTYNSSSLPTLSIDSVTVAEGDLGTASAIFTVTLSSASSQQVTVNYATANDTAVAPGDFTARSGLLTFPIGTTTQQVTVLIVGDTRDEADERFAVNLTNPIGATISQGQGTAIISDNDPPPSLSINNDSVTEGATGTAANATFTVTLSVASGQQVTVNYTTIDGTATAPADYTATAGTLTFPAGIRTQQIIVPAANDLLDENAETFTVSLSGASGATIGDAIGTGTIFDNDGPPSLTIDNVSVTEGNAGSVTAAFTVTLSAVSGRQVTVNYSTANGTATAASADYTAVATTTLTFAPGDTVRTINVSVLGDTRYEAAETFRVNLGNANRATIAVSQGTGTIVNDDTPPSLTISGPVVTEMNSGSTTMMFVATLSAPTGVDTMVSFATADGTAVAGSDYAFRSGTLTIGAGSSSGNIAITRFGDTVPEENETLFVDLSNPTNATIAQSRGTGTINDNDGTVTITAPNTAVTWTVGSARLITWTTSSNFTAGATFRVELSRDGGATFELVTASVPNATSTTGSYSWTVTGPATTQARVRVTWTVNGRVTDISNTNFTIGP